MKAILLCLCACLSLVSCSKEDATPASASIRVRNASQYQFDDVIVSTLEEENKYGTVTIGQKSDYKPFNKAYKYAYVELNAEGQKLVWHPTDYVGETPLAPGQYTYVLDVVNDNQNQKQLTIRLENP